MPQAAIFDVDRTLVDSVDLHASAWQEALERFGHHVTFEQARSQIGKGGDQLVPVFLSEPGRETMARRWKNGAATCLNRNTCPWAAVLGGPAVAAARDRRWFEGGRRVVRQGKRA